METMDKIPSVFLVDDDKMFLLSLKNELTRNFKNIRFETFSNGEDCLKELDKSPRLVILDYYLTTNESPEAMNGIQVMKEIKFLHPNIEVVMLSAQDKFEVAVNAIKSGAYEYVAKSESAFIRLFNIIGKAMYSIECARLSRKYARWNYILATLLLFFIGFMIVYYVKHINLF